MSSLTEQYAALTPEQQKQVQLALCEQAYALWLAYVSQNALTEYIETVTGTRQKLDWQLPQEAIEAVRLGRDEKNVDGRYMEPITALQDDDLEFPDEIEFAYYAIYNLFRFHVVQKLEDSWLIVNQALTALGADTAVSHLTAVINQLVQPPLYARTRCLVCGEQALQPLLNLTESGVPHGAAGHVLTFDYSAVAVCSQCGCAQLEKYSHDCFHYPGDEDWDMYWWYVLTNTAVLHLRSFLGRCPNCLDAQCGCALHTALRASSARLWGGVQHRVAPEAQTEFAWLTLAEDENLPTLHVDTQKQSGVSF